MIAAFPRRLRGSTQAAALFGALALTAWFVFAPLLSGDLVNWDDPDFFVENAAVQTGDARAIATSITLGHWYPITVGSFAIEKAVWGDEYRRYRLDGLALHVVNSWCLGAFLALAAGVSAPWAAIASFAFLLHPASSEAVGWLSARNHLLFVLAFWATCFAYLRYARRRSIFGFASTSVVYGAGLLVKETLGIFPFFAAGLDWAMNRRRAWVEKIAWLLPAAALGAMVLRWNRSGSSVAEAIHHLTFAQRAVWAIKGLVFYSTQYVWPVRMIPFYDVGQVQIEPWRYAAAAALAMAAAFGARGKRWVTLGLATFALGLAPHLKLIPFGEYGIFADRYLYFAGIGLLIAAAAALDGRKWPSLIAAGALVVACISPLRTALASWQNSETVARAALARYPETAVALNNLGRWQYENGDFESARESYAHAMKARPEMAQPYYNLGILAQKAEQFAEAEQFYKFALERNPAYGPAAQNLGAVYAQTGRLALAMEQYARVRASGQATREFFFNVGMVEAELKLCDDARRDFAEARKRGFAPPKMAEGEAMCHH